MSAAVADPRGLKRICNGCGARFYDMNKRPIICPACGTEFTGDIQVKTRRSRVAAATEGQVDEKTTKDNSNEDELEDDNVVSLDDAEQDEAGDDEDEALAGDLDLDDLEGEDDPLEDTEDDLDGLEGDVDITTDSDKD